MPRTTMSPPRWSVSWRSLRWCSEAAQAMATTVPASRRQRRRARRPRPPPTEAEAEAEAEAESLDFTGTTVSGDAFEGASLAGRPTLLWFWAPWCPTCRGQIPQVEGIAAEHAGELNVIGVGSLDSAEAIADFASDVDEVVHLEDVDGELWKRFGVTEQSSFVLLDADGAVVFEAGYGGTDDLGRAGRRRPRLTGVRVPGAGARRRHARSRQSVRVRAAAGVPLGPGDRRRLSRHGPRGRPGARADGAG